jgi:hypothetical protein
MIHLVRSGIGGYLDGMIRFILVTLVLMITLGSFLLVGLFQSETVHAYAPTTQIGAGPFAFTIHGNQVLVTSDSSSSACEPVNSVAIGGGAPLVIPASALDGPITSASICDMDADNKLELLLIARACGSGAYGSVYLLEWDNGSWIECSAGSLPDDNRVGYMGHDEFTVSGDALLNRYPLYADKDPNISPSLGERLVEYRLVGNRLVSMATIESRK